MGSGSVSATVTRSADRGASGRRLGGSANRLSLNFFSLFDLSFGLPFFASFSTHREDRRPARDLRPRPRRKSAGHRSSEWPRAAKKNSSPSRFDRGKRYVEGGEVAGISEKRMRIFFCTPFFSSKLAKDTPPPGALPSFFLLNRLNLIYLFYS